MPGKPVYKVTWRGAEAICAAIADFLAEIHEPPVQAVSLTRADITELAHPDRALTSTELPATELVATELVANAMSQIEENIGESAKKSPEPPVSADTPDCSNTSDIPDTPDTPDISDRPDIPDTLQVTGVIDHWQVEAYFPENPDPAALNSALGAYGIKAPLPVSETLAPRDWVAHALTGLGVVTCGRFILYGRHDADKISEAPQKLPIRIEANQAFGTGHHPTTAGCLALLDRLSDLTPKSVLDLGTGSAILAIAARKIWSEHQSSPAARPPSLPSDLPHTLIATDIDPVSIEIARENAVLNAVDNIEFICADGFAEARIKAVAPFEFIFANILAGPLEALAPEMRFYCAAGGHVMLAGMMSDQLEDVITAYLTAGFTRQDQLDHAVWPVCLMRRITAD